MNKSHVCREKRGFEVYMVGYPHIVYRCCDCGAPIRSIPLDDLGDENLDLAIEIMRRFRLRKSSEED